MPEEKSKPVKARSLLERKFKMENNEKYKASDEKTIGHIIYNGIQKEKKEITTWQSIKYLLRMSVWPFNFQKKHNMGDNTVDCFIIVILSGLLELIGIGLWGFGIYIISSRFLPSIINFFIQNDFVSILQNITSFIKEHVFILYSVLAILYGGIIYNVGEKLGNEKDSKKIHQYVSSITAIATTIIAIVEIISKLFFNNNGGML